jgi:polyisoprenyl-teichoic acid--peptidoglycan teichoic acid transferase
MSDYDPRRPDPQRRPYTGETVVMPGRRVEPERRSGPPSHSPAPQLPRPAPRRIWPRVRLILLVLLALLVVGLVLLYLQVRAVAAQVVVRDARLNPPIASPLAGFNLLVIGVDARPDHPEEGVRSDTLILVHIDSVGRWASTLSIPRDTQVTMRDVGETKINVAYGQGYARAEELFGTGATPEQGGMALAAETVEQFLDLPRHGQRVDYVAAVNFDGFARIVDALGGVTIDVPKRIVDDEYPTPDFGTTRIEFEPGVQHMDGARALIYARTRHADDDFGRAARQQQVIRAIVDEIRGRSLPSKLALIPRLREGLKGSVTTTLPIARLDSITGLGWLAGGLDPRDINQMRLSPETAPNVQEVGSNLIWDQSDVRAVVDSFLKRPSEASEAATVQVLNGTDISGLAGNVSLQLEKAGFILTAAGNAPPSDSARTIVYDLNSKPRTSRRVADALGAELRQGPLPEGVTSDADIVVVLGRDAAK